MSEPNIPHENLLKCKFEELPKQVTSTDHPRNKRYGGLSLLITPSSTIGEEDIAMPATSDSVEVSGEGEVEHSQQVLPISTGLVSVGTELTVAFGQVEGPVQGAVDISSSTLTDPPSNLPISPPDSSAEVTTANFSANEAKIINYISAQNVNTGPNHGNILQGVDLNIQITLEMIRDEQLVKEIYKWLSPPKESLNYNAAYAILESRSDTCQWFLKGNTFSGWLKQPGFLWIKGKSGSGKTILSNNSQCS